MEWAIAAAAGLYGMFAWLHGYSCGKRTGAVQEKLRFIEEDLGYIDEFGNEFDSGEEMAAASLRGNKAN